MWRLLDAYRSLQDTKMWSEPLVRTVGNQLAKRKEKKDIIFELTEYGEKVWRTITIETMRESR